MRGLDLSDTPLEINLLEQRRDWRLVLTCTTRTTAASSNAATCFAAAAVLGLRDETRTKFFRGWLLQVIIVPNYSR